MIAGLSYMKGREVYHRDIKPENLVINAEMTIKITDFGFTKCARELIRGLTSTCLGSRAYMAPEIIERKMYAPDVTDPFAVGTILFLMRLGFPPFGEAKE